VKLFEPHTGVSRSDRENRRARRGAVVGILVTVALLAAGLASGIFLYRSAQEQMASFEKAAPNLTTGSTTARPNDSGVTPPSSR